VHETVKDERILEILHDIIHSAGGEKNLPIGNLCSQWMGNLYLHAMDVFIKRDLGVKDYLRYCDDFCLFSDNKIQLCEWREKIREFLATRLSLRFSKSEISPVSNGVDFLGYKHFKNFILVRKKTMKKIKKQMLKIGKNMEFTERTRGQVAAAHGWLKHACTYNLRKAIDFSGLTKNCFSSLKTE
jgi:hypothetical protein